MRKRLERLMLWVDATRSGSITEIDRELVQYMTNWIMRSPEWKQLNCDHTFKSSNDKGQVCIKCNARK